MKPLIRFDRKDGCVTLNDRPMTTAEYGLLTHLRRDWKIASGKIFEVPKEECKKYQYGFHVYSSFYFALLGAQGPMLTVVKPLDNVFEEVRNGVPLYVCASRAEYVSSIDFTESLLEVRKLLFLKYAEEAPWLSTEFTDYLDGSVFLFEQAVLSTVRALARAKDGNRSLQSAAFTFLEGNDIDTIVFGINAILEHVEDTFGRNFRAKETNFLETFLAEKAKGIGVLPNDFVPLLWRDDQ